MWRAPRAQQLSRTRQPARARHPACVEPASGWPESFLGEVARGRRKLLDTRQRLAVLLAKPLGLVAAVD
jgi:hypothetical protein